MRRYYGHGYHGPLKHLLAALRQLRVWESQWTDLGYAPDDARGEIPDREQPQELITEREILAGAVCRWAAMVAGVPSHEAHLFADNPRAESNPYNIDRVRLAVAIFVGI